MVTDGHIDGHTDGRRDRASYRDVRTLLNKSNRTTMRPLGVYLIEICMYILDVIQFLMILGDFGGFA